MKKIIFLLFPLLTLAQNPTNFPYGIKNPAATSDSAPAYFTTTQVDGVHKKTPAALVAKVAIVNDSLATKENVANKATDFSVVDNVKYPSVQAVNNRWGLLQNIRFASDFTTNLFAGTGSGVSNTYISSTQGAQNTFYGINSGFSNTTGYANDNIGYNSGYSGTTATRNLNIGYQSGFRNISSSFNTNIGTDAGYRNKANNNIFIGFHAGFDASNPYDITGDKNIIIGNETASKLTTGYSNNINGYNAGFNITTGHSNLFEGYNAGLSITTGSQNVLLGVETGQALTTGTNNVYLGFRAGFFANNSTYYNTGIGDQSFFNLSTGNLNTAIGGRSGLSLTTGAYNTFIGFDSGNNASQKVDALFSTAIGWGAYNTADDQVVIGGTSVTETIIRGNVPNLTLTGTPTAPTATAGTNTTQIATTAFVQAFDTNVVHNTGAESVGGVKTFTSTPKFSTAAISINNSDDDGYGNILLNVNRFIFQDKTNAIQFLTQNSGFASYKSPSILANFINTNLTATRSYSLPDISGTLALINDTALTGTPTAPTATVGTNTTQIATTAFVLANSTASSGTFTPAAVGAITFDRCYWIKNGNVLDVVYNFSITGNTSYSATMTLPNSFTINANSNGREIGGGKITTNSGYSRVQETATSSDIFLSIVSENTGAASGFARASVLIN